MDETARSISETYSGVIRRKSELPASHTTGTTDHEGILSSFNFGMPPAKRTPRRAAS
jgi:hypothetical protein